jgi:FMN reductase
VSSLCAEACGRAYTSKALALSTPEYHVSFSSVIKLVLENLGFPSVLSGKPIALLGVAAGQSGAIVLPGPVSVAGVQRVFDEDGRCLDEGTEKRVRGVATNLIDYVRGSICPRVALEQIARESQS